MLQIHTPQKGKNIPFILSFNNKKDWGCWKKQPHWMCMESYKLNVYTMISTKEPSHAISAVICKMGFLDFLFALLFLFAHLWGFSLPLEIQT